MKMLKPFPEKMKIYLSRKANKIFLIFALISLQICTGYSAMNFSASSRYGQGSQSGLNYRYNEHYFQFNTSYNRWDLTAELQFTDPPEFGFSSTGFRQLTLSYFGENFTTEIGHIKAVFGNGLSLNIFEQKEIDFDNRPVGMKIHGNLTDNVEILALAGRKNEYRFYSPNSDLREPDGQSAFNIAGTELRLLSKDGIWSLNPYVVLSRFKSDIIQISMDTVTFVPVENTRVQHTSMLNSGLATSFFGTSFDMMIEFSMMEKQFDYPLVRQSVTQGSINVTEAVTHQKGNAFYLQWSWYPDWLTVFAEYKRYQWGIEAQQDRTNLYRQASRALPFQMGPIGLRQHDISLLANRTHPVNYSDEVGINVDVKYSVGNWIGTVNVAKLSQTTAWNNQVSDNLFYPSSLPKYLPFTEFYFELDYSGNRLTNRFVAAFTDYTESLSTERAENLQHITLTPVYSSLRIGNFVFSHIFTWQQSTKISLTLTGDEIHQESPYYSKQWVSSVDWKGQWSVSAIFDVSDESGDPENWLSGEIAYRPSPRYWLRGSYGAEKGGVRCTSGVCRIISPFEGARLSMEVRF